MVKAPKLTIEVLDQQGNPLKEVYLGSSPNQFWFYSFAELLGASVTTKQKWELEQKGEDLSAFYLAKINRTNPYMKKTDETGCAIFKSMPPGTHEFYVSAKDWEMSEESKETGDRSSIRVTIKAVDQTVRIKMRPMQKTDSRLNESGSGKSYQ